MSPSEVLENRRDVCRELLGLSQRQDALIAADDYAELLSVLGRKQGLIERLAAFQRDHRTLWANWPETRAKLPDDDRATCQRLIDETDSLLGELLQHEDQSTRELTARRDATRVELRSIDDGSRANAGYRDALAPASHRHLDVDL